MQPFPEQEELLLLLLGRLLYLYLGRYSGQQSGEGGGVSDNKTSVVKRKRKNLRCVIADTRPCCLLCDSQFLC